MHSSNREDRSEDSVPACRFPQRTPVDEDLLAWKSKRQKLRERWESRTTDGFVRLDAKFCRDVRNFCKSAMESRSNLAYAYKHLGGEFQLEADLLYFLPAFAPVDEHD